MLEPSSSPSTPPGSPPTQDLPRTIGFLGALGIMLGVIIGSGIFRTPSDIAGYLGSPWVILAMWGAGGLLSLFGALTYTELAVVFPRSGGLYNFLYQGFGRGTAFVFGWTYMLISKPFAAAAITTIFAEYLHLNDLVGRLLIEHCGFDSGFKTDMAEPVAVCILLTGLTYLNVRGMRLGAGAGVVVTSVKVLALAAICLLALVLPGGSGENFAAVARERTFIASIAPVMTAVLWTFDGWSDVGAVAGEVRTPQRTLPRVYLLGTLIAVGLYIAVNAAYMYVLPIDAIAGSKSVAGDLMTKLLGPAGGIILTGMVLTSTLGSTHASIITGARVTFAQAQDGLLFRFLARIHPEYQTPHVALWVQCVLSCTAVLFLREFSSLAGGFVFTIWIFYGLAAVAVVKLRIQRPDLPRTYRTPGYPVVPIVFIASALGMTGLSIADSPRQTLPWLGVLVAGYPIYLVWSKLVRVAPT